ncbi:hypothetical protein PIB30_035380, partial [Stylosanthes scabra]|nr:hypothetical protein [Stylosanthes scabra]
RNTNMESYRSSDMMGAVQPVDVRIYSPLTAMLLFLVGVTLQFFSPGATSYTHPL